MLYYHQDIIKTNKSACSGKNAVRNYVPSIPYWQSWKCRRVRVFSRLKCPSEWFTGFTWVRSPCLSVVSTEHKCHWLWSGNMKFQFNFGCVTLDWDWTTGSEHCSGAWVRAADGMAMNYSPPLGVSYPTQTMNAQWGLFLLDTNEAGCSLKAVKQSLSSSDALWLVLNANVASTHCN